MVTVTVAKAKKIPIMARAPEVTSREATFCRDLPRVDELIDWGFYLDFHALMDYLPTEPPVNLRNPNIVIQILKKKNPDWHCMFVGMDTYWMRTKEITKIVHLDKFQEGLDFFKSGDAALAYIHGQLNAYGYSVDGMMKSLKSMWPENEVRERAKLEKEMEMEMENENENETENPEKKNKKIKTVEYVKVQDIKRKDNTVVVVVDSSKRDALKEKTKNEKEERIRDEENMTKKRKKQEEEEKTKEREKEKTKEKEREKEKTKEKVAVDTEIATVTVAKAKKMPIVARAPEVTSREATFCRDLPRVDELIDWGFYLDFHALMDYLPTEPPVNLRNPNIVIQILKKKNPDWHCMFVVKDTYWMRTMEITKIVHLDKFVEGVDFSNLLMQL